MARATFSFKPIQGSCVEVFLSFLKLGLLSFGGPIAHLAYFRNEFVTRRRWMDDQQYADLVALCQFLPGPASSQVGMAIGMRRAGAWGAMAAWSAFTLPSALALILFAYSVDHYPAIGTSAAVQGLKIAAVAVVAQAVVGMFKSICLDSLRVGVAALAVLIALTLPAMAGQLSAIGLGALVGLRFYRNSGFQPTEGGASGGSTSLAYVAACAFALLLFGLPLLAAFNGSSTLALISSVYRAGALVFGGGHVVLPLLEDAVVSSGVVSQANFLAGYGAAQAVPGPLFTFAAYLGTVGEWPLNGWTGGLVLLLVLFTPGMLLVVAALPFWEKLRSKAPLRGALAGINASVVGILAAALYDPVWVGAVHSWTDAAIALAAFVLLVRGWFSPAIVVLLAALVAWAA